MLKKMNIHEYSDHAHRNMDVHTIFASVQVVEVHQVSELRILWRMHQMVTALRVTEDTNNLSITFELLHSEAVDKFSGKWELSRVRHPDGRVTTSETLLSICEHIRSGQNCLRYGG